VLDRFDGSTWRPSFSIQREAPAYQPSGPGYTYTLTLEPHNKPWLLALDYPGADLPFARYAPDLQLLAEQPVRSRSQFRLTAYPATAVGVEEDARIVERAKKLPARSNPRARELAGRLWAEGGSAEAMLRRTLAYFRGARFTYTLNPAPLARDSVDGFLFDTREGFCEHFSSAFVFLMRAAGVPARVVTGYQGGDFNPYDRALVIRQSDAHAWAEVWLEGRGWVRVDPTSLSAPSRIDGGLRASLADSGELPLLMRQNFAWLRDLRYRWEAVSNAWNRWVLDYTPERQRELLSLLGIGEPDWKRMTMLLTTLCAALMAGLILWAVRNRPRRDALERCWHAFCARLARAGAPRLPWEGPLAYARRVAPRFPQSAPDIDEIARHYALLRYGQATSMSARTQLRRLRTQIRHFRPR
jgi:transglutaminase-like putative cysteine protease